MLIQNVLIFVLFLGPLIFFHELGHFFFARLFGVRVEVFSIGFGPKFFRWKRGDTEYALSVIPLGGYVKMFGDDPFREQPLTPEEQKVAFNCKSKWARFWIVFGGPLANLLLAFMLYFALVVVGEKVPETRFGHIPQSSILYDLGFRSGDAFREVNGKPLVSFDDLNIAESEITEMKVERLGVLVTLTPNYNAMAFIDLLMEHSQATLRAPFLVDPQGGQWLLTKEAGKFDPSLSLEEMALTKGVLVLQKVQKIDGTGLQPEFAAETVAIELSGVEAEFWGQLRSRRLYPVDQMVGSIVMSSPADRAGLKQGDILVSIAGTPVSSFEELRQLVQKASADQKLAVGFLRAGKEQSVQLLPEKRTVEKKEILTIGVYSGIRQVLPRMRETKVEGPIAAITTAFSRTVEGVVRTVAGYKKLITNEVGLKNIGGPLAIGKVASDSFNISLSMFFRLMAIISINLGVINLFPIPVLDGGHIMFLGFELVNRGPLSRRKLELAQRFGVSFLFLLIFIAIFNDITRLFS